MENQEVLREFIRWCPVCEATVQVERWVTQTAAGLTEHEIVCRRCGRTLPEEKEVEL